MDRQSRIFTLHQGDAEASFGEHPTEIARQALIDAAEVEGYPLADQMLRFAATLPERAQLARAERLAAQFRLN